MKTLSLSAAALALFAALLVIGCNTDPAAAAEKYVADAQKYFARGKYKEASILYRRALAKNLRSGHAWYGLGQVNARLGDLPEARKDFSRAMELDPGNPDAAVQLGDLDLAFYLLDPKDGRAFLADLKEIADRLLKKDPRSFDGLRFSGNIALALNDTSTAIAKFEEANKGKGNQPDLILLLVQTLFAAGRDEEAERLASGFLDRLPSFSPLSDTLYVHYMRAKRPEAAEQVLQRKIDRNPKQADALVQLADHYFLLHRMTDAAAAVNRLTSDPKNFPEGRLNAGDFYVRVRDYKEALHQYEEGERANPKQARVYRKREAEVLATQGGLTKAGEIVAKLLKEDPKDPEAQALRATLALESGDPKQVRTSAAELEALLPKMPRNATVHFNLGRAYAALSSQEAATQNRDKAREQFEIALRLDPHHEPAKLALANLQLAQGKPAQAAQTVGELLGDDPGNSAAQLLRAKAFLKIAQPAKARAELAALIDMHPDFNAGCAELAELDFVEHRYREAEEGFRDLANAGDSRGSAGLIKTEIAEGKIEAAMKFASDQVQLSPDRGDTRRLLADTLVAAGRFDSAAAQFQKLIDRNPSSSELYLLMGEAKSRCGDVRGALAAFQTARQLAPSDARPVLDLGVLYDRTGRTQEARKEYQTVLQLQPDNVGALNNLAYLDAEEGADLNQALARAQRAQQQAPGNPDVQDTLALVYIKKNLTNDGVRMLRDLVSRNPGSAPFHIHLALALYEKGERAKARRELWTARQLAPNAKEQSEIKVLLAKVDLQISRDFSRTEN